MTNLGRKWFLSCEGDDKFTLWHDCHADFNCRVVFHPDDSDVDPDKTYLMCSFCWNQVPPEIFNRACLYVAKQNGVFEFKETDPSRTVYMSPSVDK